MHPPLSRAAAIRLGSGLADSYAGPRVLGKAFDAIAKSFDISGYFASHDWFAKNADAARRLVGALIESARWANGRHDETATILAKYTKMTAERIASMTRVSLATSLDARQTQPVLDVAYRYGRLDRRVNAAEVMLSVHEGRSNLLLSELGKGC